MATSLSLLQLLLLGTLIIPAHTQEDSICDLLPKATASNFSVSVEPDSYQANTTYTVKIRDNSENVTAYFLQALTPQNETTGEWDGKTKDCNSTLAVVNITQKEAKWTSPNISISYVEIRAYRIFNASYAEFSIKNLTNTTATTTPATTTTPASTTTPNSVSMVQSSSFFIAALQLPLLLVTSRLLS